MAGAYEDDDAMDDEQAYRNDLDAIIEAFNLNAVDAEAELEAEIAFLEAQGEG